MKYFSREPDHAGRTQTSLAARARRNGSREQLPDDGAEEPRSGRKPPGLGTPGTVKPRLRTPRFPTGHGSVTLTDLDARGEQFYTSLVPIFS